MEKNMKIKDNSFDMCVKSLIIDKVIMEQF